MTISILIIVLTKILLGCLFKNLFIEVSISAICIIFKWLMLTFCVNLIYGRDHQIENKDIVEDWLPFS